MKQSKVLVLVVVFALLGFGWFNTVKMAQYNPNKELDKKLAEADDYMNRKLYQRAEHAYEEAAEILDSEEIRDKVLEAYKCRYEEEKKERKKYIAAAKAAFEAFPENENYALTVIELYLDNDKVSDAYKFATNAISSGCKSETLKQKTLELEYSYKMGDDDYTKVSLLGEKRYATELDGLYTYVDTQGNVKKYNMKYASIVGEKGTSVVCEFDPAKEKANEKNNQPADPLVIKIVDKDGMILGYLDKIPEDVGVFAEDKVAVKYDNSFSFYDSKGDKLFGSYEAAGRFMDGKAAVCENGKWFLVDTDGEKASDNEYEDIKLAMDGSYIYKKIMIAKEDGKYHLYDEEMKVKGDFAADDMDIMTDDKLIAYKEGDKWGFVNSKGEVVIEPQYTQAKSFSHGLAAVSDGTKWGFINEDNVLVIDYIFFDAGYFNKDGGCMVKKTSNFWRYIGRNVNE